MRDLETKGISVLIDNESKTFIVYSIASLSDNLDSHQIGGDIENFSKSHYISSWYLLGLRKEKHALSY